MILAIKIKMEQPIIVLHLRSLKKQIQHYQGKLFSVCNCMYIHLTIHLLYGRFCSIKKERKERRKSLQMLKCQPSFPATAGVRLCFYTTSFGDQQVSQILLLFNTRACNVSDNSNSKV